MSSDSEYRGSPSDTRSSMVAHGYVEFFVAIIRLFVDVEFLTEVLHMFSKSFIICVVLFLEFIDPH